MDTRKLFTVVISLVLGVSLIPGGNRAQAEPEPDSAARESGDSGERSHQKKTDKEATFTPARLDRIAAALAGVGQPKGRSESGSTRGALSALTIHPLVPLTVGQTLSHQPTVHWYLQGEIPEDAVGDCL